MEIQSSNKRIAKNTIMLYIRMIVNMAINLYASRVIIQTLGVSDYGVYGVVGGIVTMFSFLNGSMAGATSRFLSFALGTGDNETLRNTFSSALILHLTIAILVTIICETFGIWFLENRLVVPDERMSAAGWVLQFSIIAMFFQVAQVPFNSAIISHEKMDVFAYIEIINSVLKLLIVYLLSIGNFDKLILYSILTCIVSITIATIYSIYGLSHFKECSFKLSWNKDVIKPMLSYSGWEFYGNMSLVAITQGVNMLLNMWFGTIMNAAYDIASRVKGIIMSLSTSVTTAIRPQIVKTYSVEDYNRMFSLMMNGTRVTFVLMLLFCGPLLAEPHYILNLWLGVVPEHAETLLRLSLVWNIFVSMSVTPGDVVHATGDVKTMGFWVGTMYLLIFPITYFAFKLGAPYWLPFVLNAVAVMTAPFYTGYVIKKHIHGFSWRKHILRDLVRCYLILLLVLIIPIIMEMIMEEGIARLIISTVLSASVTGTAGFFILFPYELRDKLILSFIRKVLKHHDN